MRILLDESLPRRLIGELPGHTVSTVTENAWSALENSELLRAAAGSFDAFLTADQNLEYQQNLSELPVAVAEITRLQARQCHQLRTCRDSMELARLPVAPLRVPLSHRPRLV